MKKIILLFACFTFLVVGFTIPAEAYFNTTVVLSVTGEAKVILPGKTDSQPLKERMRLKEGTLIITGKDGSVTLSYNKKKTNLVIIKENSMLMLNFTDNYNFALAKGTLFFNLRGERKSKTMFGHSKKKKTKSFLVYTPEKKLCTIGNIPVKVTYDTTVGKTIVTEAGKTITAAETTPAP